MMQTVSTHTGDVAATECPDQLQFQSAASKRHPDDARTSSQSKCGDEFLLGSLHHGPQA